MMASVTSEYKRRCRRLREVGYEPSRMTVAETHQATLYLDAISGGVNEKEAFIDFMTGNRKFRWELERRACAKAPGRANDLGLEDLTIAEPTCWPP